MKPYLVVVDDNARAAPLANVGVLLAENEEQAQAKAQNLFPDMHSENLCVYDIYELDRDYPNGWVYLD